MRPSGPGPEEWCYTHQEVDALREQERQRLGHDVVVDEAPAGEQGNGHGMPPGAFIDLRRLSPLFAQRGRATPCLGARFALDAG